MGSFRVTIPGKLPPSFDTDIPRGTSMETTPVRRVDALDSSTALLPSAVAPPLRRAACAG